MDKESLEKVQDKIADLLNNVDIPITDKIELLINLMHFLNDYEDNIRVLEEHRLRLKNKED